MPVQHRSSDVLRELPTALRNLSRLLPGRQDVDARLQEFKRFYDEADLSPGKNFLTEDMKANQALSITILKSLMTGCRNVFYTELDDFIQWNDQNDDDVLVQLIDEIIENVNPSEEELRVLRMNRGMFLYAGQVAASLDGEQLASAQSMLDIFSINNRGPFAVRVVAEMESTNDSSNDGN